MLVDNVEIPPELENCREAWLYLVRGHWIISTKSKELARFAKKNDALEWWEKFETIRGFSVKAPQNIIRHKKSLNTATTLSRKTTQSLNTLNKPNIKPLIPKQIHKKNTKPIPPTSGLVSINTGQKKSNLAGSFCNNSTNQNISNNRQAILARINQGYYDNEANLLSLMRNAIEKGEDKFLNAVHQRLKIVAPETYRKLVGPLHVRDPLGNKNCYCGNPASLNKIKNDIITDNILDVSLLCDACWEEDICFTWGYYGAWGAKIIDTKIWRVICERRGATKYATY